MLYDGEVKTDVSKVERYRRGEGSFALFRFRNKEDLIKFAELLDEPRLKSMKPGDPDMKIKWHADSSKRNALGNFFGDDDE